MDTFIKTVKPGELLNLKGFKTIRVLEVWDYDQCFDYDIKEQRQRLNEILREQLGSDFRDLYYQVFCEVVTSTKKSKFKPKQKLVLDWRLIQKYIKV